MASLAPPSGGAYLNLLPGIRGRRRLTSKPPVVLFIVKETTESGNGRREPGRRHLPWRERRNRGIMCRRKEPWRRSVRGQSKTVCGSGRLLGDGDKMPTISSYQGRLTKVAEWLGCEFWLQWCSLRSIPWFVEDQRVDRRDCLVLGSLAFSVVLLLFAVPQGGCGAIAAAWAAYRAFDAFVIFFCLGVFQRIGRITLTDLSSKPPRLQRHLITVMLNYVELLFVYAILYRWLGYYLPGAFSSPVACSSQAFAVSFMTMTTIGYGNIAPVMSWALFLATAQALSAILAVVVYVANVIALLSGGQRTRSSDAVDRPSDADNRPWLRRIISALHFLTPLVVLALVMVAFWCAAG